MGMQDFIKLRVHSQIYLVMERVREAWPPLSTKRIRTLLHPQWGLGASRLAILEPPLFPDHDFHLQLYDARGHRLNDDHQAVFVALYALQSFQLDHLPMGSTLKIGMGHPTARPYPLILNHLNQGVLTTPPFRSPSMQMHPYPLAKGHIWFMTREDPLADLTPSLQEALQSLCWVILKSHESHTQLQRLAQIIERETHFKHHLFLMPSALSHGLSTHFSLWGKLPYDLSPLQASYPLFQKLMQEGFGLHPCRVEGCGSIFHLYPEKNDGALSSKDALKNFGLKMELTLLQRGRVMLP